VNAAPAEVCVPDLEEAVVEDIVRWYVLNADAPAGSLAVVVFGVRGPSSAPWNVRAEIGVVLGECPYRVSAGNPFSPTATITAVERRVIAEVAYERCCRLVGHLQTLQGVDVWPETIDAQRDRDVWHRMEHRYRQHPSWRPAMTWLQRVFGFVVHGDPARGRRGDASFLPYIQGA
jgi:hypothetical protein